MGSHYMRKIFIILIVIFAILFLVFVFGYFQAQYKKVLFEQPIEVENVHSNTLKQFLTSIAAKSMKYIIFKAHSNRNNFFVVLSGEFNIEQLKKYNNDDLVKFSENNTSLIKKLQRYNFLDSSKKYDRYLFTDINYPLNIYVQNNKIIIIYPILTEKSIENILPGLKNYE